MSQINSSLDATRFEPYFSIQDAASILNVQTPILISTCKANHVEIFNIGGCSLIHKEDLKKSPCFTSS